MNRDSKWKSRLEVLVRNALDARGVVVRRKRTESERGLSYSLVTPEASYAPWLDEAEFRGCYDQIRNHTLVDEYRCYELWQLLSQVLHLPGDILEVGVWRGGTGVLLAARSQSAGSAKAVYLCDTFAGVVKASELDGAYRGGEHSDTSPDVVRRLIQERNLDADRIKILQGIFPDETGHLMTSDSLCFVHIDVDVYQSAKDVLDYVWPKIPVGGVIVFDDYGFKACDGVTRLVNERVTHKDQITFHNLNGHAVVLKLRADRKE